MSLKRSIAANPSNGSDAIDGDFCGMTDTL
jgi:hypothetical protein